MRDSLIAVFTISLYFQNSPLYIGGIGNDSGSDNELSRQWLVHTALDALEERLTTTGNGAAGANANAARTDMRDLYLGLLYSTDTHKMLVIFYATKYIPNFTRLQRVVFGFC